MANPHLQHTTTAVPTHFYVRPAGATPTPMAPWRQRRIALAARIASRGETGMPVNIKHTLKTNTGEGVSVDLRRLIDEGYAVLSAKSRGPFLRRIGGGKQYKVVRLTPKGLRLLPAVET